MEMLGLIVMVMGGVLVCLPVFATLRLFRLTREVQELRARVTQLEIRVQKTPSPSPSPSTSATGTARPVPEPAVPQPAARLTEAAAAPIFAPPPTSVVLDPPSSPVPPFAPSRPPAVDTARDDLDSAGAFEQRVGSRWLLYVGVLTLVLGIAFFLKYAIDSEWLGETGRVLLGAVVGVALVVGGWRTATNGLSRFGLALSGLGHSALYLSIYAAFDFYALIGAAVAFALFVAVLLAATWQAHRSGSQALAIIAAGGGYLTPFLVGGTANAQVALMLYDLLLGVGILALFARHQWLVLPLLSFVATLLTVGTWSAEWYTDAQWLSTWAFATAFCALFLGMLRRALQSPNTNARAAAVPLWLAPVIYHLCALALTWNHPPALHLYLIVVTAMTLFATTGSERVWLRVVMLFAAYVPLLVFVGEPPDAPTPVADVVAAVAVAVLHLIGLLDRTLRQGKAQTSADLLLTHLLGIGLFGILSQVAQTERATWQGTIAAALIVVGLLVKLAPLRWIGMVVMGMTVAKVFLSDLSQLGGIYRVMGFIGVGALLVAVSYLYQRKPDGQQA